ncbi:DUF3617 domain-containing protein [Sphingomicrobium sediminis]|uniref:Lipoprotein n=1 Tax=Sphingomicrobium sediminis TaxID=2950949 RepID=A0A9X2ELK9_9SPHN|nr:hypothetical protein [Sphingomicrobium sediminis]MCM8557609.1 hypothetical protein [Sphingomicrobium sediminis]
MFARSVWVVLAAGLVTGCGQDLEAAASEEPVEILAGRYEVVPKRKIFEAFYADFAEPKTAMCVQADSILDAKKLVRLYLPSNEICTQGTWEREGNAFRAAGSCRHPAFEGSIAIVIEGVISAEGYEGHIRFDPEDDATTISPEELAQLKAMGSLDSPISARRTGDCSF